MRSTVGVRTKGGMSRFFPELKALDKLNPNKLRAKVGVSTLIDEGLKAKVRQNVQRLSKEKTHLTVTWARLACVQTHNRWYERFSCRNFCEY